MLNNTAWQEKLHCMYVASIEYCSNYYLFVSGTSTAGGLPVVTITIVAIILFIMVVAIIITTTFVLYFKLWKKSDYHSKACLLKHEATNFVLCFVIGMGVPEEYLGHVPLNTLNTAAHSEDNKSAEKQRIDNRFNLKRINLDDIVFFKLKTSYPIELKTLVEGALKPRKFERGCAFYEFLYKEDISDVQEIVFVNVCDVIVIFCFACVMVDCIVSYRKMVNIFFLTLARTNYMLKNSLVKTYCHQSLRVTEYLFRVQDQEGGTYQRRVWHYTR